MSEQRLESNPPTVPIPSGGARTSARPRPMPRPRPEPAGAAAADAVAFTKRGTTSSRAKVDSKVGREADQQVEPARRTRSAPQTRVDQVTVVEWTGEHVAAPNATYTRHRSLRRRWREYWIARSVASGRRKAERKERRIEQRRAARRA